MNIPHYCVACWLRKCDQVLCTDVACYCVCRERVLTSAEEHIRENTTGCFCGHDHGASDGAALYDIDDIFMRGGAS